VCSVGNAWIDQTIFFVDFEGSRSSGVLEYGVVGLLRGEIIETKTRLCRAIGAVRREDTAVHGLSGEMLCGQSAFVDDWEYFADRRERGPLAAHYAGVENALLKSVWPYPRNSPDFARPGERVVDWGPWVDTARLFGQLVPTFSSGRLESLVAMCNLQTRLDEAAARLCPADRCGYHCALYDALAGALLLAELGSDPQIGAMSMMQLLALSTLDPQKRDSLQQTELF
jgi:DNA polymerase III epsilon subunit-like protein